MRRAWAAAGFADPRQEISWQQKFATDQAGLDAAVSLQTLLFPSLVARTLAWMQLWEHFRTGQGTLGAVEVLWLATFLAWAPLFLWLAHRRPAAYLRWRTKLVLLARLHRQITVLRYSGRFNSEAMGLGSSGGWPTMLEGKLGLLLWRPGSIATLLGSYILPLKFSAPCALLLLATTLHSTLQQCSSECAGSMQVEAGRMYTDLAQRLRWWQVPWVEGSTADSAATCNAAAGLLPAGAGTCSVQGCRDSCVAVHAWLQLVLGTLLPLVVLWAVEERSRLRFRQRWLDYYVPPADGTATAQPSATSMKPFPAIALLVWFLVCACTLAALIAALIL